MHEQCIYKYIIVEYIFISKELGTRGAYKQLQMGLISFVEISAKILKVLAWLPFWPYVKGFALLLLAIPYYGGASYVYLHFVRPYISAESCAHDKLLTPEAEVCVPVKGNQFPDAAGGCTEEKLDKWTICEVVTGHTSYHSVSSKKLQREWSCALCLGSTSSENCLQAHLQGRRHKVKENEIREIEGILSKPIYVSSKMKRIKQSTLFESINEMTWDNFETFTGFLNPVTKPIKWSTWTKPESGWTKLNTDGSVDQENAGFGGLLRNYKGEAICAYVSRARSDDIFLVELWAIWRGLVLALGIGIKAIWVESDSMSAVKTINKEQAYGSKASAYLKHIWKLLKKFEKYHVSHAWRETNKAADHLAKLDVPGHDVILWPADFPKSLWKIIKDDAKGKWYRRA